MTFFIRAIQCIDVPEKKNNFLTVQMHNPKQLAQKSILIIIQEGQSIITNHTHIYKYTDS